MISFDNLLAMIADNVNFEKQMAQENVSPQNFYRNFLESQIFLYSYSSCFLLQTQIPNQGLARMRTVGNGDSTDCAKLKNPFVCNLKPG